ncbi:protein ENL-like isoform X2 [Antedon mediterranea]|uniref:protein ENL-like isoform X2 n=1 Tax=Antedon mediterranea TaxID=105859 RepID=UPI003AF77B2E
MTTQCVQVKLDLGHRASFRKEPTPKGFTHDWSVFVRGPDGNNIQHFVEKVVFVLHDSFNKPRRVKKEPPYEIEEVGYAGFHLPIEVHFKNKEEPKKVVFEYDMFLHLEKSPPVNHIRYEKLTFRNPTEDFRRKLLKGGGVGINPDAPDLNSSSLETTTGPLETSLMPVHTVQVPKVKGKPHAAASNALALKKPKEKKEGSSRSPVASKPSKGKEPKSMTPKESKPKDPNKQNVKRQSNPSNSAPEQIKKRKKSSSGLKTGEKNDKPNSNEKIKLKEKVKQPKVQEEPLFKPEAVVERKNKTKPEPPKKMLPPFDAELSTEEIEDVPSPGSSTSFSSFPNKQSGGALNTLMQEFMQESDNEDLEDSSEIVGTPFQGEPYKAVLSDDDSDNEQHHFNQSSPAPVATPPPVEKPKTTQKTTQKKATNGKKSKVNEKKDRTTEVKKVKKPAVAKKTELEELVDLHQRLMSLHNREHLQKVADLIEETGLFQITTSTFDFDLCSLDKSTIQKLQNCIETLVM